MYEVIDLGASLNPADIRRLYKGGNYENFGKRNGARGGAGVGDF